MFHPEKFREEQVSYLRKIMNEGKAVTPVLGGVYSTVSAVLTHEAVGDRTIAVLIDDGLMGRGELENVINFFKGSAMNIRLVDAAREFSGALKGVTEPQEQRKVYRNTFYTVLGRVIREEEACYLVRGTTAADIVETEEGIEIQDDILEQVGIRILDPRHYGPTVIEPLSTLNKHEVRKLAKSLGLPPELSERQPFPVVLNMIRESVVK